MRKNSYAPTFILLGMYLYVFTLDASALTLIATHESESSSAYVLPTHYNGRPGISVIFEGTDDLHYYATSKEDGVELRVSARANGLIFANTVYPEYKYYDDPVTGKTEVYIGNFTVFVPITNASDVSQKIKISVSIRGLVCTSKLCIGFVEKEIIAKVDFSQSGKWPKIDFKAAPPREQTTDPQTTTQKTAEADAGLADMLSAWSETSDDDSEAGGSVLWYFLLAILAGLSINIMPCVLPVIPLIIMRLVGQAKESGPKRVALGFSFCGGIILFFATFAAISTIIQLSTGVALDLNSLYRNPAAVITLFLFIVFFALVLMDVLVITLPSSVAGHQSTGGGFAGSIGMGFFAGILSTPCSGAIIGAVLVWAQTQPWSVSATALVLMGAGMALPYAILVSIPKLLDFVPKPGTWMEIFKKTGGFLLLIIAAKFMLAGLAKDHLLNVLLYGVIFAFCVWMWGTWITFSTPKGKKLAVRAIALALAVGTGFWLLPAPRQSQIDWKKYDPQLLQRSLENNNPVLLKFTADWCTNCKIVDKNVYQDPKTIAFLNQRGFVTINADTTQKDYQATVDYKLIFKEAGNVPNTILLNPERQTITKIRGVFTTEELIARILEQN